MREKESARDLALSVALVHTLTLFHTLSQSTSPSLFLPFSHSLAPSRRALSQTPTHTHCLSSSLCLASLPHHSPSTTCVLSSRACTLFSFSLSPLPLTLSLARKLYQCVCVSLDVSETLLHIGGPGALCVPGFFVLRHTATYSEQVDNTLQRTVTHCYDSTIVAGGNTQ